MSSTLRMTFIGIGVIVFVSTVAACSNGVMDSQKGEKTMPVRPIKEVLAEHTEELMSIQGVVGTAEGLCDDKPCIKIFVIKKTPELDEKIPDVLEGCTVELVETGEIRALTDE